MKPHKTPKLTLEEKIEKKIEYFGSNKFMFLTMLLSILIVILIGVFLGAE